MNALSILYFNHNQPMYDVFNTMSLSNRISFYFRVKQMMDKKYIMEEEFIARGYETLLVVSGFSEVPFGFEREASGLFK